MRNKTIRFAAAAVLVATTAAGCQSVTARTNRRSAAHVKYEASRHIQCAEDKLLIECTDAFKSGECMEYVVHGCNNAVSYRNLPGDGWTPGE